MFYSKKKQKRMMKGFLLPEVILSLFILTIGIVTVVSLIGSSLHESLGSRDIITATFLTQEGIELVRNIRDTGFVRKPTDPFEKFDSGKKNCRIDFDGNYSSGLICNNTIGTEKNFSLERNPAKNNFYDHTAATGKFLRYIYIDYNGTNAAVVTSFVYWGYLQPGMFQASDGSTGTVTGCTVKRKCVYTTIYLTNWRP